MYFISFQVCSRSLDFLIPNLRLFTEFSCTTWTLRLQKHASQFTNLLCKLTCWCKDQSLALLQRHIEFLQNGDSKRCCFAGARLRLSNHVVTLDAGYDCTLLDCRRLLKAIGIDSTQQVFFETHVIKVVNHLIPVALQYNQYRHHHHGPATVPLTLVKHVTHSGPEVFVRLASRWNSLMMMMMMVHLHVWKLKAVDSLCHCLSAAILTHSTIGIPIRSLILSAKHCLGLLNILIFCHRAHDLSRCRHTGPLTKTFNNKRNNNNLRAHAKCIV